MVYSILFYSIPSYPIQSNPIPFYPILSHSILHYYILQAGHCTMTSCYGIQKEAIQLPCSSPFRWPFTRSSTHSDQRDTISMSHGRTFQGRSRTRVLARRRAFTSANRPRGNSAERENCEQSAGGTGEWRGRIADRKWSKHEDRCSRAQRHDVSSDSLIGLF